MHARFARLASLGKIHPRYSCLEKRIRDNISTNGGNRAGKTQANSGSHFFRLEIFTPRCRGRGHCTTSATLKTTWILFSSDVFTTVTVHTYPFWSENVDFFRRFGLPKCIFLNRSPECFEAPSTRIRLNRYAVLEASKFVWTGPNLSLTAVPLYLRLPRLLTSAISLNFIRLLRVVITQRRKRLEAIGWISGYSAICPRK